MVAERPPSLKIEELELYDKRFSKFINFYDEWPWHQLFWKGDMKKSSNTVLRTNKGRTNKGQITFSKKNTRN